MSMVIYYPNKSRLTFYDTAGMPMCGFIGDSAHLKAIALAAAGEIVTVNIEQKAKSRKQKAKSNNN
jgi:hypothetical protein